MGEGLLARWRRPRWDGTRGTPRSANRASSAHLRWEVPVGTWVGAEATLTVLRPPQVPRLVFWALQVSVADRGRRGGGAHLGLQWHPPHPGSTAVNWGGYRPQGGELDGSASALPSATGNANTRDLAWEVGRPYRLAVGPAPTPGPDGVAGWRGTVTDLATGVATVVRDLWAPGTEVVDPMVWTEAFVDCDHPPTSVSWSALAVVGADGARVPVRAVRTSYQSVADGGCATSDSSPGDGSLVQATGVRRVTPAGTRLELPDR